MNETVAAALTITMAGALVISACVSRQPTGALPSGPSAPPGLAPLVYPLPTHAAGSSMVLVGEGVRFRDGWVMKWGQSPATLRSHFPDSPINCEKATSGPAEQACVLPALILPRPYDTGHGFANFYQGKLFCLWLFFNRVEFDRIAAALEQTLGQPEVSGPTVRRWSPGNVMVDLFLTRARGTQGRLVLTYKPVMKSMMESMPKSLEF